VLHGNLILLREAVAVVTVLPDYFAERDASAQRVEATRRCAEGIIVGLRRCSLEAASRELVQVAGQYRLDTYRIARALVRLAQEVDPESDSVATSVARLCLGRPATP
jgi:hypothetical protein